MQSVKLGKYKIAFWHPTNATVVYSTMYDDILKADAEIKVLQHAGYLTTMMEARVVGDGTYTWEILPYGVGKYIPLMSKLYTHRLVIGIGLALLFTRRLR